MNNISLINLEWNITNGLIFELLTINDRSLFMMNTDFNNFLIFDLVFLKLNIFDKTN